MLDLTSSSFLGLHHASGELGPWSRLTTGRPAALGEPELAGLVAERVAARHGAAAGVVHRSALHALVDVVDALAPTAVVVDACVYPLARLAAGAAAGCHGAPVRTFAHHDVRAAARLLVGSGPRPVVVTDGWCAGCNRPAPLQGLERAARARGGTLVVDDTQAFGVLGRRQRAQDSQRGARPTPVADPTGRRRAVTADGFGYDGGGTWWWSGGRAHGAVQVVSLAKGLGVPLAVTTGPGPLVQRLRTHGSRWHSSAPSTPDLLAAVRATDPAAGVDLHRRRCRLWRLVRALHDGLRRLGLQPVGAPFPIVPVHTPGLDATRLARRLREHGVRALVLAPACRPVPTLTFLLTADHSVHDVRSALAAVAAVVERERVAA